MSRLSNNFVYGNENKVKQFEKYVNELKELKSKDEIEDIDSVEKEHIITAIAKLQDNIINNIGEHDKITIFLKDGIHTYDKAELLFEVLSWLYLMAMKDGNK